MDAPALFALSSACYLPGTLACALRRADALLYALTAAYAAASLLLGVPGRAAGFIVAGSAIPYIISILRKETVPSRASWGIWAATSFLMGSSYFFSGARATFWAALAGMANPVIIFLLALRYGKKEDRWGRACVRIAVLCGIMWAFAGPVAALVLAILMDGFGGIPTLRKAWRDPASENKPSWIVFCAANALNILAAEEWSFAILAHPVWMAAGSGAVVAVILARAPRAQVAPWTSPSSRG